MYFIEFQLIWIQLAYIQIPIASASCLLQELNLKGILKSVQNGAHSMIAMVCQVVARVLLGGC